MQELVDLIPLIVRAKAKDDAAFAALYEKTYPIVYNIACALLKHEEEAKDVVSEVFIRVYRSLSTLQDDHSFIPWLTVITKNVCRDHRTEWRLEHAARPLFIESPESNDPIAEWHRQDALQTMMKSIIRSLPEPQQRAVDCVYFKQLSIGQTAALEGCSINTIKTRLFYARDTLRRAILAEEERTGDKFHLPVATVALSAIMALPQVGFSLAPEEAAKILASVFTALGIQYAGERAAPIVTVIHEADGEEPRAGSAVRRSYLVKLRPIFLGAVLVLAVAAGLLIAGISYARGRQSAQTLSPPQTMAPLLQAASTTTAAATDVPDANASSAPNGQLQAEIDGVIYRYTIEEQQAAITEVIHTADSPAAITLPSALDGVPVTTLGWHAFAGCQTLAAVTIPDSVTTLSSMLFYGCPALEKVVVPASVNVLYHGSYSPTPKTVDYIYGGPFAGWPGAKTAGPIGSGCNIEFGWTTELPGFAFAGCANLTEVTIPDTVTMLGGYLFSHCDSLTQITLPPAIRDCGIKAPAFEDGIRVNGGVFAGWPNARTAGPEGTGCNIVLTGGYLPTHLFYGCTALEQVIIPDSVTQLGGFLFHDCTALKQVIVLASVKGMNQCRFTFGTTSYAGSTFAGWPNARTAGPLGSGCSIEFAWTRIPDFAFWGCTSLEQVTVPDSVTTLGRHVFDDCTALKLLTFTGNAPHLASDSLDGLPAETVIHRPSAAQGWDSAAWQRYPTELH